MKSKECSGDSCGLWRLWYEGCNNGRFKKYYWKFGAGFGGSGMKAVTKAGFKKNCFLQR
jgi:hypothetical protein